MLASRQADKLPIGVWGRVSRVQGFGGLWGSGLRDLEFRVISYKGLGPQKQVAKVGKIMA